MHEKLLLVFEDSEVLNVDMSLGNEGSNSVINFDMNDILDFLKTWKKGMHKRFMVKEIKNKFRFGVAFSFVNNKQFKNESLLYILVR